MPARLLGIGLPLSIVAGCVVALGVFGPLSFGEALVLAIILAPTDAALGQSVVVDQRVPSRVRQGLNVESGLNDGICVPLLFIAIALADAESHAVSTRGAVTYLLEEFGGLANAVTFIVFGAAIVGPALGAMTWSIAVYALLSVTVVRMLPVAVALIGTRARPATVAFLGWFGPRASHRSSLR